MIGECCCGRYVDATNEEDGDDDDDDVDDKYPPRRHGRVVRSHPTATATATLQLPFLVLAPSSSADDIELHSQLIM